MRVGNVRAVGRADERAHDFGSFRLRDLDGIGNGTRRDGTEQNGEEANVIRIILILRERCPSPPNQFVVPTAILHYSQP